MLSTDNDSLVGSYESKLNATANELIASNGTDPHRQMQLALLNASQKLAMFIIVTVMLGLGCSTDIKQIISYFKRPKEFMTGILLQLFGMPLIGLAITQLLGMTIPETLGVIFQAVAPGGTYSNLVTYWMDGDTNLSVIMTSTSNLVALGSMTLWLLVISKVLRLDQQFAVPFAPVAIGLASATIPLIIGMVIRHFFPKIAPTITKVLTVIGSLGIAVGPVITGLGGAYDYHFSYKIFLAAILMITSAVMLGYAAARAPCLNLKPSCRRAIAIETAFQSTPVAYSIVMLSFSPSNPEVFGPVSFFPVLYGVLMIVLSFVVIIGYKLLKAKGVKCIIPEDINLKTEMDDVPKTFLESQSSRTDKIQTVYLSVPTKTTKADCFTQAFPVLCENAFV